MIASVLVVTTAGWFVTERIVEPRLIQWNPDADASETENEKKQDLALQAINPLERKGLRGTLVSSMVPYSIAFAIGWTILLVIWYLIGLPLGPGAGITM